MRCAPLPGAALAMLALASQGMSAVFVSQPKNVLFLNSFSRLVSKNAQRHAVAYRRLGPHSLCQSWRPTKCPLFVTNNAYVSAFPPLSMCVISSTGMPLCHFASRVSTYAFSLPPRVETKRDQKNKSGSSGNTDRNLQERLCVLAFPATVFRPGKPRRKRGKC